MIIKNSIENNTATTEQDKQNKLISLSRKRLNIDEALAEGIIFKIAESYDELEQAYRLVHQIYEEEGYTDAHLSGMRLNAYNAHPDTVIFIAKKDANVIMTMTLVADSPFGLPMDDLYLEELSPFREMHHHIGQLCALASLPEYRCANQALPLFIIKLMRLYARDYMRLDDLVMTINPKHTLFYESLLLFKRFGELKACQEVKDHPAYAYLLELEDLPENYEEIYAGLPPEKNLHHFFYLKEHSNLYLPDIKTPLYIWDNDKLDHFFTKKTDVFHQIDEHHLSYLLRRHASYWRTESILVETAQNAKYS